MPLGAERPEGVEEAGWELNGTGVSIIATSGHVHRATPAGSPTQLTANRDCAYFKDL